MLLCVAVIVAACFACVPTQQTSSSSTSVAAFRATKVLACDANNPSVFLSRLYTLSNYDPDPNNSGKLLPVGTPGVSDPYCTSLTNAYNFASPSFRTALDSLTRTFIDTDSCSPGTPCSWGFYDNHTQRTFNTYVALPASLWSSGGTVPTYPDLIATTIVPDLLAASPVHPNPPIPSPISVQSNLSASDMQNLTLVAMLAHELGHIKWWKHGVEKLNKTSHTCLDPVTGTYTVFADITWKRHSNAPIWRYFGKENPGNATIDGADKDKLAKDLGTSNEISDLTTIYDGKWASIFSTVSPDEDYVETYTLIQLVSSMRNTVSGATLQVTLLPNNQVVNLLNYFDNPSDTANFQDLYHKARWIEACAD
jgi:hypothetical protein